MKVLVNYANDKYIEAQRLNTWFGKYIAKVDKVYSFGPNDIDDDYKLAHGNILNVPRGNGLWLWKPYFINKVLDDCADGDYLFYVDSGAFFIKNVNKMIESFRENESIWVSDNPTIESCFTKPKCFEMLGCSGSKFSDTNQIQATYLGIHCCPESRAFIKEWLHLCENEELIAPEGDLNIVECRDNSFVAHREDQSILSLLCKMRGIVPHRDPSQRGAFPETFYSDKYRYSVPKHDDKYGILIFLHKKPKLTIPLFVRVIVSTLRDIIKVKRKEKV